MFGKLRRVYFSMAGRNAIERCMCLIYLLLHRRLVAKGLVDINGCRLVVSRKLWPHHDITQRHGDIICITGFGHSGSGAALDLLSEYDGVDSFAYADSNGSLRSSSGTEFSLLCDAGGLFSLERAFESRNEAERDAAVKIFLRLVDYLYHQVGMVFNDDFIGLTRKFLDEIVLGFSDAIGPYGYAYCPHLSVLGTAGADLMGKCWKSRIVWLKDLTVDEFRQIARHYISEVLRSLSDGSCLLLDHAVNDGSADMTKYQAYIDPMKNIAVYRDPRDVYATAQILKERWIPSDPDMFISWYLHRISPYLSLAHKDFMLIRFEELVMNYEKTVRDIEKFVCFCPDRHVRPKASFDPAVSRKNVGIYRSINNQEAVEKICSALNKYCWEA